MKSLVVNIVLNAAALAIIPVLALVWLVRVHTIEFLQERERSRRRQAPAQPRRAFGGLHGEHGRREAAPLHGRTAQRF